MLVRASGLMVLFVILVWIFHFSCEMLLLILSNIVFFGSGFLLRYFIVLIFIALYMVSLLLTRYTLKSGL